MKKPLLLLSLLAVIVFFSACQKELSVETGSNPSSGSLQSDVTGDCLPKTVSGIYEAGTALNGTNNYIDVQVSVATAGSYVVYSDTVNGIFFRSIGVFTATGMNTVRLKGNGTPALAGTQNYVIRYDTTECAVPVTVLPAGGATPAVLTLAGAPGACIVANLAGAYVATVALDITNTVTIGVNVGTAGTYNITTVTSNGMVFTGTGSVAAGAQNITLNGSGTPATAGIANIVVTVGTSTCNFPITVIANTPLAGDYFPLTANSWWSYDDNDGLFVSGDSLTRLNIDVATYLGNTYRLFQNQDETTPQDSSYYRKVGADYIELNVADAYTAVIAFDAPVIGQLNFLKDNLTTNQTWESNEFSGTASGVALKIKYVYKCLDANGTFAVNGHTFTNVYKISWKPQIKVGTAPAYQDEFYSFDSYYAKGVGLVYMKLTDLSGAFPPAAINIKNWKVF